MAETSVANASNTEASSSSQDYNLSNPLFLHPRENPGAILTSQPLIGGEKDRKSTRLNSSHSTLSRMPSSA